MDIEAVIAALGEHYDADETAVIERVPRQYGGTVPDQQLIEEVGLALAILRRGAGRDSNPPPRNVPCHVPDAT